MAMREMVLPRAQEENGDAPIARQLPSNVVNPEHTIGSKMLREVYPYLYQRNVWLQVADVVTADDPRAPGGSKPLKTPYITNSPLANVPKAPLNPDQIIVVADEEPVWGRESLEPDKFARGIRVSVELSTDSPSHEAAATQWLQSAVGADSLLQSTTDILTRVDDSTLVGLTLDNLFKLKASVMPEYWPRAIWMFAPSLYDQFRGQGQSVVGGWEPRIDERDFDRFDGHRVVVNEAMETVGTGKEVLFGDPMAVKVYLPVMETRVDRETYIDFYQYMYKAVLRLKAALTLGDAFKYLALS